MAISLEIISKELIKPSSPTPSHLKNIKLSFLDQISPPIYIPIILFYQPKSSPKDFKQSLSQILTRFYPLAGRLNSDGFTIDCNDDGVEYIESRVLTSLSEVIENPNVEELGKLLPLYPGDHFSNVVLLSVQINYFSCGGLAVAVCMSHRIADGFSLASFVNAWSYESLGKTELIQDPDFHSAYELFAPNDLSSNYKPPYATTQEQSVTKRFVFDKVKITKLKQELGSNIITPSSVEAVSAFIWKQSINISNAKKNVNRQKILTHVGGHAVNLRTKTSPPLKDTAFGNLWCYASTPMLNGEEQVVECLRNAIKKVDNDYMKSLEENGGWYVDYMWNLMDGVTRESEGNIEYAFFSSWWRFPFYDVDFGFGNPLWVCTTLHSKNFVIMMRTKEGDGMEVWLDAPEADMAELETQHGLL